MSSFDNASWNVTDPRYRRAMRNSRINAVVSFTAASNRNVKRSMENGFDRPPAAGLGTLQLPTELLFVICKYLDISSFMALSKVNRGARLLAIGVPEYRLAVKHYLTSLQAVLRTKISRNYTLKQLRVAAETEECSACGLFAGFIFLPTFARCCYDCLCNRHEFAIIKEVDFNIVIGVAWTAYNPRTLLRRESLPVVHVTPNTYSTSRWHWRRNVRLVALREAAAILMKYGIPCPSESKRFRYAAATALPFVDQETGKSEIGSLCARCKHLFRPKDYEQHVRECARIVRRR